MLVRESPIAIHDDRQVPRHGFGLDEFRETFFHSLDGAPQGDDVREVQEGSAYPARLLDHADEWKVERLTVLG